MPPIAFVVILFTYEMRLFFGTPGGSRTHRTLVLSQVRLPVTSPGHMASPKGFEPLHQGS